MRVLLVALLLAGCGTEAPRADADVDAGRDADARPDCPPNAEGFMAAACEPGVDTTCRGPRGETCKCVCLGYWECDQVGPRDCGVAAPGRDR